MTLSELSLTNFRNYDALSVDFASGMNVIWGENAQGKTNLLEAIGYLSSAKSHRSRTDAELIQFGTDSAQIKAKLQHRGRTFEMAAELKRTGRRHMTVNHQKVQKLAELSDTCRTVLFCPEDLRLIQDGAALRRAWLDQAIGSLRPKYADALLFYQRALTQKTRILRSEDGRFLPVLAEFNEALARAGALLIRHRSYFMRRLYPYMEEVVGDFSRASESLSACYETSAGIGDPFGSTQSIYEALKTQLDEAETQERHARLCLVGPHRDDVVVQLDGKDARRFASQGQARTLALSLKLAERMLSAEDTGSMPLLLLDDVLSELDEKRQGFVLERIGDGQVFLTTCTKPLALAAGSRCISIHQGALLGIESN